jgi:NADPH-dependent 2,4-dienoyl-CoA reductase/sulfur reductase-like enzyme
VTVERAEVVVVGSGLAGLRVCVGLRRHGFEGRIVLLGEEAVPPYDRPPLSKDVLLGTRDPASVELRTPDALAALDLDLRLGVSVLGVDLAAGEVLSDTGRLGFAHLVIATGAAARTVPALDGFEGVTTLRTLDDALVIRNAFAGVGHIVVVGAGFIGAEVASTARQRGIEVTVLELDEVPLGRVLGQTLGAGFARLHREHGTDLRLGVTIDRVDLDGRRVARLHLTDGTAVEPELVVVGVGAVPAVDWLADSGLQLGNGVVCDTSLRASDPRVFAIGDVCNWPNELFDRRMRVEHWTNAAEQGAHVAREIVDGAGAPFRGSNFVWSDQYGVRIQFVGVSTDDVVVLEGDPGAAGGYLAWYREGERVVGGLAVDRPRLLAQTRKLIEEGSTFAEGVDALEASSG